MKATIEKGFKILSVDITEFICNNLDISYQVDDTEKDEYKNVLKFGSWSLRKEFSNLDNLVIELDGTFLLVNDQIISAELTNCFIEDNEDVYYHIDDSEICESVKCRIS